ncbi:hypothetical protein [Microvirga vignae]|nr:hypothetical protein [Microvirga vignae]
MNNHHRTPCSIGIDIGKEVFHLVGFGADCRWTSWREIPTCAVAIDMLA